MLERNEYYVFKTEPSNYEVKFVCNGFRKVFVDLNIIHDRVESIYKKNDGNLISVTRISKIKDGMYTSDGVALPAKYIGKGEQKYFDNLGTLLEVTEGYVFMLYTVPVVLTKEQVKKMIHPQLVTEPL